MQELCFINQLAFTRTCLMPSSSSFKKKKQDHLLDSPSFSTVICKHVSFYYLKISHGPFPPEQCSPVCVIAGRDCNFTPVGLNHHQYHTIAPPPPQKK
eukprot:c8105_g2_i1 orf=2-292(-)